MGTLAVNLTEDVQNKLIQQYKTAIEKAVDIYVAKTSKLSEKSEKYQFDPFKDTVNDLITYFNMTLSLVIGTHFDEWRTGNNSITKLLENIESDNDAAIQNAKMFENKLYEAEKEAIQSHRIAELNHPTTNPNFKIPELQEDMRTVQQACDEIDTLKKETSAIFEEEAENNSVYSSVMSFIEMTLIELVGQFNGTKTAIDEKCIRAEQNTSNVVKAGADAYERAKTSKSISEAQIADQARQKNMNRN